MSKDYSVLSVFVTGKCLKIRLLNRLFSLVEKKSFNINLRTLSLLSTLTFWLLFGVRKHYYTLSWDRYVRLTTGIGFISSDQPLTSDIQIYDSERFGALTESISLLSWERYILVKSLSLKLWIIGEDVDNFLWRLFSSSDSLVNFSSSQPLPHYALKETLLEVIGKIFLF